MSPLAKHLRVLRSLGLGLGLVLSLRAAETDSAAQEHAALLHGLDADLARLDVVIGKLNDPALQRLTLEFAAKFKANRDKLREAFEQARFDEVKFEVTCETQRLLQWLAFPVTPAPGSVDAVVAQQIVYLLEPVPEDPADVKAALAAADFEIDRQEKERATGGFGFDRKAETARIAALRIQRAALQRAFTSEGWSSLLGQMKTRF